MKKKQEEYIEITSEEQLAEVKATFDRNQRVIGKCSVCGIEKKTTLKRFKITLLCKNCKTKATNVKKYGVPYVGMSKDVQERIKATNIERYGSENPFGNKDIQERIKATNIEKYGAKNPFQSELIKDKIKKTIIERYGVDNPMKSLEVQERSKATMLERYGAEYSGQSDVLKAKARATNLERYGVEYASQNNDIKAKVRATNLERYGVEYDFQSEDVKQKTKATMLEKYGVEHPMQSEELKEKLRNTFLQRYGTKAPFQNKVIAERIRNILLQRYGTEHAPSKKYQFDGIYFDSTWELAFYIRMKDEGKNIKQSTSVFEYQFNGEIHNYYPDFEIDDTVIEVKGSQFFKTLEDGTTIMVNPFDHSEDGLFQAKYQCALEHNVRFVLSEEALECVQYVKDTYGESYMESFKL